jgi:hypothetical protein
MSTTNHDAVRRSALSAQSLGLRRRKRPRRAPKGDYAGAGHDHEASPGHSPNASASAPWSTGLRVYSALPYGIVMYVGRYVLTVPALDVQVPTSA